MSEEEKQTLDSNWIIKSGLVGMVREIIRNQFRASPEAIKPIDERIYRKVRRGLRIVAHRAGWPEGMPTDRQIWDAMKDLGIVGTWQPKEVKEGAK